VKTSLRIFLLVLVTATVFGSLTGCATKQSQGYAATDWSKPVQWDEDALRAKIWDGPMPSNINEGR
jgi:hypothetical protein